MKAMNMVSTSLLGIWLTAIKHIFLLRVINKGIMLTNNISDVKYISLCRFTISSSTFTRSPATGMGFLLVIFTFKYGTLLYHMLWATTNVLYRQWTIIGLISLYDPLVDFNWLVTKRRIQLLCLFISLDIFLAVTFLVAWECVKKQIVFNFWSIVM